MTKIICENIECKKLYIDKGFNTIRLHISFEHAEERYNAFFRYISPSKEWYLANIHHNDDTACQKCIEFVPKIKQHRLQCNFFNEKRVEIAKEILANATIEEKLRNFRLEAITSGFNY
jgi:hypothetical protein